MAHCTINFSGLQRPEHVVALMIAASVQNGDHWSVVGPIPAGLRMVLDRAHVAWSACAAAPADATNQTDRLVRITEIEQGLARYVQISAAGTLAIAYLALRYRIVLEMCSGGMFVHGAFDTPHTALAALHRLPAAALPAAGHRVVADCAPPTDLALWVLDRTPQSAPRHLPRAPEGVTFHATAVRSASPPRARGNFVQHAGL